MEDVRTISIAAAARTKARAPVPPPRAKQASRAHATPSPSTKIGQILLARPTTRASKGGGRLQRQQANSRARASIMTSR